VNWLLRKCLHACVPESGCLGGAADGGWRKEGRPGASWSSHGVSGSPSGSPRACSSPLTHSKHTEFPSAHPASSCSTRSIPPPSALRSSATGPRAASMRCLARTRGQRALACAASHSPSALNPHRPPPSTYGSPAAHSSSRHPAPVNQLASALPSLTPATASRRSMAIRAAAPPASSPPAVADHSWLSELPDGSALAPAQLWQAILHTYDAAQASGACSKTDTQVRKRAFPLNPTPCISSRPAVPHC
jgi:hypothetical protein